MSLWRMTRGQFLVHLTKSNSSQVTKDDKNSSHDTTMNFTSDDSVVDPTFNSVDLDEACNTESSTSRYNSTDYSIESDLVCNSNILDSVLVNKPESFNSFKQSEDFFNTEVLPYCGNADNNQENMQNWINVIPTCEIENNDNFAESSLEFVLPSTFNKVEVEFSENTKMKQNNKTKNQDSLQIASLNNNDQDKLNLVYKKTSKKKTTVCKFCRLEVTNFERHLERNHSEYKEVQEIISLPKKSLERQKAISLIRNAGHFTEYLAGNTKPKYCSGNVLNKQYYPCAYCKGLYSKTYLARHGKNCIIKDFTRDNTKFKHLSASQTLIACALERNNNLNKLRVKEEVFNIMKADEISLVAKTDNLICHFGENYLKKHKRQQMATVCSNKMREHARFLIEIRKTTNNENVTLIDVLQPSMFDTVIECAKKIGGYDASTKSFNAPSLSAHIGTSLKQVSDLLIRLILKEDKSIECEDLEKKIKYIKRFRNLVTTQWTTEISSIAFKNLNEKKWNKPVILPLTKDILKFKEYVTQIGNKSVAVLQKNTSDKKEFKNLVDATLTLTILYNRKRIGDVQYTLLKTYLQNFSSINQEECLNTLTESEKILTQHYKRVVTGGKGSRAIVILFPQNLQNYVNTIIELRNSSNLLPHNNPNLFAYPDTDRWARGDVAIRRFAKKANLEYPLEITSNKLRKQIATVMQILNLDKEESEQFAQFMGHTEKTHNEFYKLPQDIYQTSKISKLLILMDKGSCHHFKGKSLQEIDIDPEKELAETDGSDDENEDINYNQRPKLLKQSDYSTNATKKVLKTSGRTPWTDEQVQVVKKCFSDHIKTKKAPKKKRM